MQKLILILALVTLANTTAAQQTRREVTNAATTIDDSKPNNDLVPDVYTLTGTFERIEVLRLKYKADLLAGLEAMMKQQKIRNAVILSGIGSVRSYQYHVVSNRTFPSKNMYVTDTSAPADLVNMNGYIINGRVHAHVTFANADKAFGGHLESGTNVFTFAIVTIGVLSDTADLSRVDDKTYR
jgi:predicted DNA-binding protein with PD1-like motif